MAYSDLHSRADIWVSSIRGSAPQSPARAIASTFAAGVTAYFHFPRRQCRLEFDDPSAACAQYYLMVGILAFAMGVQNVVVRRVGGLTVYTTFVTGALVQFGEAVSQ
jgi:Protein of unknown function (DUF1275)